MKLVKNHITQNTINLIFLPICLTLIVLSFTHSDQSAFQQKLAFTATVLFVLVSVIHHYFDKSLTFEIIFEYILIASLVFLAVFTLIV